MSMTTRDVFAQFTDAETFARIVEYDTVTEMWEHCAKDYADRIAIEDNGVKYSFAELDRQAEQFRTVVKAGEEKEVRVGIYSPNSFEFVKAYLAVVTLGYTAVVIPPQLDAGTVFGCARKYGLKQLIFHPALEGNLEVLKSQAPDVKIINIMEEAKEATPAVTPDKKTPCLVIFTGGTTGRSKGALLSNQAVMQGTVNGCYGYPDVFYQRYILVLPFSHVFGLIRNLMTSLYTGSTLFICRNNKDMFRDVAVFKPTILVAVPALVELALSLSAKFGKNMLGEDLKTIISGAAPVNPYLITECDKLGITLLPGYGLTESANLFSGNPISMEKNESVGLPFPNQEYKIVDEELWIKGLNMLECYIGEDEEAFEDGWFKTGDLVRVDEDGYFYITGRKKEIIILSNGENISPAVVEAEFNKLPFVMDSQVFEAVAENGTHILALEIVPRESGVAAIEAEDKNAYMMAELNRVNDSLQSYEKVSRIEIRTSDFARTPAMKIIRYKLDK